MDALQVILCGSGAYAVEASLRGTVDSPHPAWGKAFVFSCLPVSRIEQVENAVLCNSHAVVLCPGCRRPPGRECYNNCPVVALDGATQACVDDVQDSEFFYGVVDAAGLREKLVSMCLAPTHIIYDALLQCLTPVGEEALKRAFWLLDKDCTGILRQEELQQWLRQSRGVPSVSTEDLEAFLQEWSDFFTPDGTCMCEQFVDLHLHWLTMHHNLEAWATLFSCGTGPQGLPYSWTDLHAVRLDKDQNSYLSPQGLGFFRNVYKLKKFRELNMWSVTPGCPWDGLNGFRSTGITLDKFIEYWKYMALEQRDAVIRYARCWGYKGEPNFLFVRRSSRAAREATEALPNAVQVFVVGSPHCGRKRLMTTLTAEPGEEYRHIPRYEIYARTTTFFPPTGPNGQEEEPQTIVYTTVGSDKCDLVLGNENLNRTFDATILCVDATNFPRSSTYIMELLSQVADSETSCPRMPHVLVLTKCEGGFGNIEEIEETAAGRIFRRFCRQHQLLWPPVRTSCEQPDLTELGSINEYMYSVICDPEVARGPPPLTLVRRLRRATFVALVGVVLVGTVQTIANFFRSKRK